MSTLIGKGAVEKPLTVAEIREICAEAISNLSLTGKRVIVLIPDHTRHAPIDLFFNIMFELVADKATALDYLVATGTHFPMSMEGIYRHVGISGQEHAEKYSKIHFFNHEHNNLSELVSIGTIPADEIDELTGGLFKREIEVTINKKVLEYDQVLMITPVVPHEAMGFAGGDKYFFPGIAGLDVVETFHWLAAVITNPVINGVKDTPTRRVIDRAAKFLKVPRLCFAFAVDNSDHIACLFAGEPQKAWSLAADYSARLHINYVEKPFGLVLGITPSIYEDIWVAGKAMYKLEPVVADGGELIIYGPHIHEISFSHGDAVRRIGYHVRDYFLQQWDRFSEEPKLIMAHSTNVRGIGAYENGVERPRIKVTLATSIPEKVCRSVNLGYLDPRSVDLDEWRSKQNDDLLVVENAGQVLYRLRPKSTEFRNLSQL
jgi:nickel-dependent lactate racemase